MRGGGCVVASVSLLQSEEAPAGHGVGEERNVIRAMLATLDERDASVSRLIANEVAVARSVRSTTGGLIHSRGFPIAAGAIESQCLPGLGDGQFLREKRRGRIDGVNLWTVIPSRKMAPAQKQAAEYGSEPKMNEVLFHRFVFAP